LLDASRGRLTFGDGRRGMIPPPGLNGVVARRYFVGGGAGGNVNPGTLTSPLRALAYVDGVANPIAAAGGADRETVDEAKERAPRALQSRDRAVTSDDFESLALAASTAVARARCLPDPTARASIAVVILPKAPAGPADLGRRPVAPSEVLRQVARYLDQRRLVGTVVQVRRPRYRDLSLEVTLLGRASAPSDATRGEIEARLRRHLHPLVGGRDGRGWDFGRPVLEAELLQIVEGVAGVGASPAVTIRDERGGVADGRVGPLHLDGDELPFLGEVRVVERLRAGVEAW
jgi:predicted phage baseplate assembly protein